MQRVAIVSGGCGVGKSTALRSMRSALAGVVDEVAVLETDHFYMMIDPDWALPWSEAQRYFELSGRLLRDVVSGFLSAGFDLVAIGSNGLCEEPHVRAFVEPWVGSGVDVHHVTLDPGVDCLCERMAERAASHSYATDVKKTPEWLESQLLWFRERYGPWTYVIDNSSLTPAETAQAIYGAVEAGRGHVG